MPHSFPETRIILLSGSKLSVRLNACERPLKAQPRRLTSTYPWLTCLLRMCPSWTIPAMSIILTRHTGARCCQSFLRIGRKGPASMFLIKLEPELWSSMLFETSSGAGDTGLLLEPWNIAGSCGSMPVHLLMLDLVVHRLLHVFLDLSFSSVSNQLPITEKKEKMLASWKKVENISVTRKKLFS